MASEVAELQGKDDSNLPKGKAVREDGARTVRLHDATNDQEHGAD